MKNKFEPISDSIINILRSIYRFIKKHDIMLRKYKNRHDWCESCLWFDMNRGICGSKQIPNCSVYSAWADYQRRAEIAEQTHNCSINRERDKLKDEKMIEIEIDNIDRFIEIIRSIPKPMIDEDSGVFRATNHGGVVIHIYRAGPLIEKQEDAIRKIEAGTGEEVASA